MLVLTRNAGQAIDLTCPDGSKAEIVVLRVNKRSVSIGLNAPESIEILRRELSLQNKAHQQTHTSLRPTQVTGQISLPGA